MYVQVISKFNTATKGTAFIIFFSCIAILIFSSNLSLIFIFPSSLISSSVFFTVFSDASLSRDTCTPEPQWFCIPGRSKIRVEDASSEPKGLFQPCKRSKCLIHFPYSSSNTNVPFDQHLSPLVESVLVYSSIHQSCYALSRSWIVELTFNQCSKTSFLLRAPLACSTEMLNNFPRIKDTVCLSCKKAL